MPPSEFDREMMAIALRMAKRGLGQTAPNPAVGAVIADDTSGEVLARGWTQPGGRPHAETEAIRRAGARARGATLYVTLEPCAHHGQTPPCADAIIAAGIKRVVIGAGDPDPRTNGAGVARLRAAGIEVTERVLEDEARWLTLGHILCVTKIRPFVQLKLAIGPDGSVPRGYAGQPMIVTGDEARALGHLLRAEADAIVVGSNTVADDDPELTCRLPGLAERSPLRVVLSSRVDGLVGSHLVRSANTVPLLIVTGPEARDETVSALKSRGAEVERVPVIAGALDLNSTMAVLAHRGITRLLVEGGPKIWGAFARAGLVDEVVLFHARVNEPHATGAYHQKSLQHAAAHYVPNVRLDEGEGRAIGRDWVWRRRAIG